MTQLQAWHEEFMREHIEPIVLSKGEALLRQHLEAGDKVAIVTATNRFITGPIAARLGVDTLLATECEMRDGRYTGRLTDIPCFQEGKVQRIERWLAETEQSLEGSYFYSDSRNDLPLLERVTHPVAVDPDPVLRAIAEERGWQVIRCARDPTNDAPCCGAALMRHPKGPTPRSACRDTARTLTRGAACPRPSNNAVPDRSWWSPWPPHCA